MIKFRAGNEQEMSRGKEEAEAKTVLYGCGMDFDVSFRLKSALVRGNFWEGELSRPHDALPPGVPLDRTGQEQVGKAGRRQKPCGIRHRAELAHAVAFAAGCGGWRRLWLAQI